MATKRAFISIVLCAFLLAGAEAAERVLRVEVLPDNGRGKVWNLSDVLAEDDLGTVYRAYGDTIVSEEYDGFRTWYSTDSLGFVRAEGLLWRADPDTAVAAGRWQPDAVGCREYFGATFVRETLPDGTTGGLIERKAVENGRLVLPGPDTIAAYMTAETLVLGDYRREVRRWFASADAGACALPVAMSVRTGYEGAMGAERTFVAAGAELPEVEADVPDLTTLLVSNDGHTLTVSATSPLGTAVSIDVTDVGGTTFGSAVLTAGSYSVSIDLTALPRGTYLAIISAPGAVPRKIKL